MTKYFFILISFLITQNSIGQCKLVIIQEGKKCELMSEAIVVDHDEVRPKRMNDSTIEFALNLKEPEYLYILLDTVKHPNINMGHNWKARMWIAPEVKRRELVINYSTKTFQIKDVIKWNKTANNLHEYDSITQIIEHLDNSDKFTEELNTIIPYIMKNPDSYLSLWFFTHSHALYIESNDKKLALFNALNPALQKYPDYRETKADLSGRKYPNIGDTFKEFTLTDVNGKVFNSASIKNKWILLHFWSNGCGPCVKEMDAMVNYYKTLDTSKIAFISIALDDDRSKWEKSATTNKIRWTNLWESDGSYGDLCLNYNVYSMPFFILFNNEKKLVVMQDGADAIETTIKDYLNKVK